MFTESGYRPQTVVFTKKRHSLALLSLGNLHDKRIGRAVIWIPTGLARRYRSESARERLIIGRVDKTWVPSLYAWFRRCKASSQPRRPRISTFSAQWWVPGLFTHRPLWYSTKIENINSIYLRFTFTSCNWHETEQCFRVSIIEFN